MLLKKCQFHEIQPLIQEYTQSLSSPFDSFLEEHILSSEFYAILDSAQAIGYFAIHDNQLLTQFYIQRPYLMYAQELFAQVIVSHGVKTLYVPTCDELFVSLALDADYPIGKQAYFFQDSGLNVPENESLEGDEFAPATQDDRIPMQEMCGDFLDQYERRIANGELFTYRRGSVLLGVGVLEKSKMLHGLASIGMFTNEAYRRQGIGRNLILKLKSWCYNHRLEPVCGCWYYNEASKKTLESAGMVTKTRLLNLSVR